MRVERLVLAGFRSYPDLEVTFSSGPQVIAGPNAAGKTNLLEALVVLALGRSHRTSSDLELITWDRSFARLEVTISTDAAVDGEPGRPSDHGSQRLELVIARPGVAASRKRLRINGVPRRTAALGAAFRAVLFAPEDMLLVVGSPALRRATLDMLVTQREPEGAAVLSTYARALQQRNTLLRRVRDGEAAADELSYWDTVIVRDGGRIVAWRHEALASLARPLADAHTEIAPAEGRLSLRYLTNAPALPGESPDAALRRRLSETAEKELWNGSTLVGPHRDDLVFEIGGRDLAAFASRGQQRTAILALKLAHLELLSLRDGQPPLLLLDDVFSELDPARRAHLVRRIGELPQAFVTTTTLDDLDPRLVDASTAWHVEPGRLSRSRADEHRATAGIPA